MLQSTEMPPFSTETSRRCMAARFSAHFAFPFVSAFRPCVFGFLGLALAVAAWGFGYKVSLYQTDSGTRSIVAKLWDRHHSCQIKESSVLKAKFIPRHSQADDIFVRDPRHFPRPAIARLSTLPRIPRSLISIEYHLPFRSPPFRNLA